MAIPLRFLVRLQDFCIETLSTLLSEKRHKLFEHCRHLPLECSPQVSPRHQSHHHVSGLSSSNSASKLLGSLISTILQSAAQEQSHSTLQLCKKTQQSTVCNQALFHWFMYAYPLLTLEQDVGKLYWRTLPVPKVTLKLLSIAFYKQPKSLTFIMRSQSHGFLTSQYFQSREPRQVCIPYTVPLKHNIALV